MTAWDLKDSVDIFSDADQIILLCHCGEHA